MGPQAELCRCARCCCLRRWYDAGMLVLRCSSWGRVASASLAAGAEVCLPHHTVSAQSALRLGGALAVVQCARAAAPPTAARSRLRHPGATPTCASGWRCGCTSEPVSNVPLRFGQVEYANELSGATLGLQPPPLATRPACVPLLVFRNPDDVVRLRKCLYKWPDVNTAAVSCTAAAARQLQHPAASPCKGYPFQAPPVRSRPSSVAALIAARLCRLIVSHRDALKAS